jgi:hypothetical protein
LSDAKPTAHVFLKNELLSDESSLAFGQSVDVNADKTHDSEFFNIDLLGNYREEIISAFESPFKG